MQMISARPLVEKFRSGSFEEEEIGPYVIATVVMESIVWAFAYGEESPWSVFFSIAGIVVTIFGILHLKRRNGNTFGEGFVLKFFALGWVVTIRLMLLSIPIGLLLFGLAFAAGDGRSIEAIGAIFMIALAVAEYVWLGCLIAATRNPVE